MAEFEQRIQLVTESEDEFMLSLVKLYRTANPTASTEDINRAIKGNFSVEYLPTFAAAFLFSILIHMRPQSHMMGWVESMDLWIMDHGSWIMSNSAI